MIIMMIMLISNSRSLSLKLLKYRSNSYTVLYSSDSSGGGANNNKDGDNLNKWFNEELKEGTTHIKYNKYAPSSEEAKNMTSLQFRKVIFDRMLQAETDRRKQGVVGNANSDGYLNSLEGKDTSTTKKSFNPFKKN